MTSLRDPSYVDGVWTIVVPGGPAFMINASAACQRAAATFPIGPTRKTLLRLAGACEEANAKAGGE